MNKVNATVDFQYDTLVDRLNICNRVDEIKRIKKLVTLKRPQIIFAPRRYGKTSIMRNVIMEDFIKSKNIPIYVDLMDVSSLESIAERLGNSLSIAFAKHVKIKSFMLQLSQYFKSLKMTISIDAMTQLPTIDISGDASPRRNMLNDIFAGIEKLAKQYEVLLIFDEFQDIDNVPEATAIFRQHLQKLNKIAVILSGSKRHLLTDMFSKNQSPFFNYGEEIFFEEISVEEWLPYFQQRLKPVKKSISRAALNVLMCEMSQVPNAICEVGFWLKESSLANDFFEPDIHRELLRMVDAKSHSLRFQLSQMSPTAIQVISAIASRQFVLQIAGKDFVNECRAAQSAIRKIVGKLMASGFVEWELDKGYRLSDPVLSYFLKNQSKNRIR